MLSCPGLKPPPDVIGTAIDRISTNVAHFGRIEIAVEVFLDMSQADSSSEVVIDRWERDTAVI